MGEAYQATDWHDFYVCIGASAAALMGLIFVALSLQATSVARHEIWRGRARGALIRLFTLLLIATLALVPGQPSWLLGVELLVWGLPMLGLGLNHHIRIQRKIHLPLLASAMRLLGISMSLLLVIAGLSLVIQRFGGLFWLVPTSLVAFSTALFQAWDLVFSGVEGRPGATAAGSGAARGPLPRSNV